MLLAGMIAPLKLVSFDDEGGSPEITSAEWILLEKSIAEAAGFIAGTDATRPHS